MRSSPRHEAQRPTRLRATSRLHPPREGPVPFLRRQVEVTTRQTDVEATVPDWFGIMASGQVFNKRSQAQTMA